MLSLAIRNLTTMKKIIVSVILIYIIISINLLYANDDKPDTIDLQDKKYHELIAKGKKLENNGALEGALKQYFVSLCIERYEACSYYAMLDMARVYLKMKKYPEAIHFLKEYISKVEDELSPGSPCASYTSKKWQKELLKTKEEAKKMLKNSISAFCKEINNHFICDKIKPYNMQ